MEEKNSYLMKICCIGSADAKLKTGLIRRYAGDKSEEDSLLPTIGVDIKTKIINIDGSRVKIILVDTAGQEFFGKRRPSYYRGASGAIIFFDKGYITSFTEVQILLK